MRGDFARTRGRRWRQMDSYGTPCYLPFQNGRPVTPENSKSRCAQARTLAPIPPRHPLTPPARGQHESPRPCRPCGRRPRCRGISKCQAQESGSAQNDRLLHAACRPLSAIPEAGAQAGKLQGCGPQRTSFRPLKRILLHTSILRIDTYPPQAPRRPELPSRHGQSNQPRPQSHETPRFRLDMCNDFGIGTNSIPSTQQETTNKEKMMNEIHRYHPAQGNGI